MHIANRLFSSLGISLFTGVCILLLAANPAAASKDAAADIRELTPLLVDENPSIRTIGADTLKLFGQTAMIPLCDIYKNGNEQERRGAIMGLALLPYPALAMDVLISALNDDDIPTRSLAAHGLAHTGSYGATKLVAQLNHANDHIRGGTAYALSLMGKKGVPALTDALSSKDIFVRAKSAWLLGRMGQNAMSATPALVAALKSDDIRVMHVVAEAIDLIGPEPAVLLHHLILLDARLGCPSLRLGKEGAPTLVQLLSRPGTPLGQVAFRALAMIGHDAEHPLRESLASGNPSEQTGAALLLMKIDPDIIHTLPESIRASLTGATQQHQ